MQRSDKPRPCVRASRASETWARRLQRGEPAAVQEVQKRVSRILAHGRLAIPGQERSDLEQEVVTEVWQAVTRSRFDFSGGFWGFVEVVTSRRCIDWLRARKDRVSLPEDLSSQGRGPLRQALERERRELAKKILAELEPSCRELVTLRLRDNLAYRDIARTVGKSEGALRVQFYRCIGHARRVLKRLIQSTEVERAERGH